MSISSRNARDSGPPVGEFKSPKRNDIWLFKLASWVEKEWRVGGGAPQELL